MLCAIPAALELARQDVLGVPGGRHVADTIIANLRSISPLYPRDAAIMLTDGPWPEQACRVAPSDGNGSRRGGKTTTRSTAASLKPEAKAEQETELHD